MRRRSLILLVPLLLWADLDAGAQTQRIDDFQAYEDGGLPTSWQYLVDRRHLVPVSEQYMAPRERFTVKSEGGNRFVRVYTEGEAVHLTLANDGERILDWNTSSHPVLSWDWRALRLPTGAREDVDRLNDTGAGVYVVFKMDGFLIKRPKAIKYTYSSSLPVGTVVSYGSLRVVVVSSAREGYGAWEHIERNVVEDYRRLFGEDPPDRPLSLRLWGDSDDTGGIGEADFDNIQVLPSR
ncbi:MAG: DUF3047 domain-containing protein [Rhodothermales bacterium]|nr:DUF3047 domain-containing protein [Rhodothermales bacterium]MBO6778858.1 DUF3047 domain-containing protein [Rhodothermales bacterium]